MQPIFRLAVMVLCLALASCQRASDSTALEPATHEAPLYYHVFVRSFTDSDGDQNGDLQGIIDSLDYLQSVGVTGLLLTPLYPSQFYHNYFADDFYGIDPEFGTMETYLSLVDALHDRGMTLIMDQEIQYVSGQHEWFTAALNNPDAAVDGMALFEDDANSRPVGTLIGRTVFDVWPAQQQTIVTVDMLNPRVQTYFEDYLLFWMDPNGDGDVSDGVDGFRIDHMMDDLDNAGILTGLFDDFWIPIFDSLRARNADILIIAEQADWGYGEIFLNEGETDVVFGFPVWDAATRMDAGALAEALRRTNTIISPDKGQFIFIENHDTPRFAGGERNRAEILKLGAAVNLLTGWTPIIYYGQEIGMTGEKAHSDDEAELLRASIDDARDIPVRQAFRWHAEHADGSLATWYRAYPDAYPIADSNQPGDGVSVAEQDGDSTSLLNTYRRLSALRAGHAALAAGRTSVMAQEGDVILLRRSTEDAAALVAFNFSDEPASISWRGDGSLERIYGEAGIENGEDQVLATLDGYAAVVWDFTGE